MSIIDLWCSKVCDYPSKAGRRAHGYFAEDGKGNEDGESDRELVEREVSRRWDDRIVRGTVSVFIAR